MVTDAKHSCEVDSKAFTVKSPEVVMVWTIVVACSTFQLVTEPREDKELTSTLGSTELIWLLLRPALALPRAPNVSAEKVWMLPARAADTYRKKYTRV